MRTEVLIEAVPGRLPRMRAVGGMAARCTEPDTVHLISTAATPLGGDVISMRVVVQAGARLRLRSAAATLALPGPETVHSATHWDIEVAGDLDLDPEPTVVAGGAAHVNTMRLRVSESGQVRIRERVQIGRSGERDGNWSGALHVDLVSAQRNTPLVRHRVELGNGAVGDDVIAAPRAYVSELRYPTTSFDGDGLVMALAGGGSLATWQGDRLPPQS